MIRLCTHVTVFNAKSVSWLLITKCIRRWKWRIVLVPVQFNGFYALFCRINLPYQHRLQSFKSSMSFNHSSRLSRIVSVHFICPMSSLWSSAESVQATLIMWFIYWNLPALCVHLSTRVQTFQHLVAFTVADATTPTTTTTTGWNNQECDLYERWQQQ